MKPKLLIILSFLLLFIVSCSPSDDKIQDLLEKTKNANMSQEIEDYRVTETLTVVFTDTPEIEPTPTPTKVPDLPPTPSPMVENSLYPDAKRIELSEFRTIDDNYNKQQLLALPCMVMYIEQEIVLCSWPAEDNAGYGVIYESKVDNLEIGEIIYVFGKYKISQHDVEGAQKTMPVFDGINLEKEFKDFAYEPKTSDLIYYTKVQPSPADESLGEIPHNYKLFSEELVGRFVKLPCVVSEIKKDNELYCVWTEAEKEYYVYTYTDSFSSLEVTDRLKIYGFNTSIFTCFKQVGSIPLEMTCVPVIVLTNVEME